MSAPTVDYRTIERRFRRRYGKPIGRGRWRVTFRDGDTVLKVPVSEGGCFANLAEIGTWDNRHEPRARTWQDEDWTERTGVPISRAEYVEDWFEWRKRTGSTDRLPAWTDFVDCHQVGYTSTGRLVAYDFERIGR